MIRIKIKTIKDRRLLNLSSLKSGAWIDLLNPSPNEIRRISKETGVPRIVLITPLDINERPRIEKGRNYVLVIIRAPIMEFNGKRFEITTIPIGIIITKKYIITVSRKEVDILEDFHNGIVKGFYTTKKVRFLLQILERTINYYSYYLEEIKNEITELENMLTKSFSNEEVIKALKLQKTLIYFNVAINGNAKVFEKIISGKFFRLKEQDLDILEDILIDNAELSENVKVFSEILSGTLDAYASIISNNLNMIMKFLTSLTIIMSIPTIISSIYGMNIKLPIQWHPYAFYILMIITFLISGIFAYVFWKKGWF